VGTVIWDGDASKGTGIFKILNTESGATITIVDDPAAGRVFKFLKPSGSNRCEAHGAKGFTAKEGDLLYIGWRAKLTMPTSLTTNAIFQWKAYGANLQQNFPVVLKTLNGKLSLEQFNPGGVRTVVWSTPLVTETWHRFVLGIKVSSDIKAGYLEFWYEGVQQMLPNNSTRFYCRTLDADYCDPKWGVYGAQDTEAANQVDGLRLATTREAAEAP
jgi:hypothetical protein